MAKGIEMIIHELDKNFGCFIDKNDSSDSFTTEWVKKIENVLEKYKFVVLRGLCLDPEKLEKLGSMFGQFADNPYLESLKDYNQVVEVRRSANETAPVFGSDWHSDWSFQTEPPVYTFLYAKNIPPVGGQTSFADCVAAYERLDPDEKFLLTKFKGKHSAEKAYGLKGLFAKDDETRSMRITVSADAASHVFHPAVRTIPESQEKSLFINPVYTVDLLDEENRSHSSKLDQLIRNITAPRYQFKLNWGDGFLVIWDNRRVIHKAEGGYDGYDRLLLRVTIGNERPR